MELEEVNAVWSLLQESEVAVRHFCRVERGSTEGKHEGEDTKGEDVCCVCFAWEVSSCVDLWSHVDLSAHFLGDQIVLWHGETEVAELEDSLVVDQYVFKLDVHVRELS